MRPATIAMLEAMLDKGLMPVVPCQGSVGASGDLAPLAHMAAAMIGVGEMDTPAWPHAGRARRCASTGLAPLALGPKEGLALLNGTQFSTAYALAALFAAATLFRTRAWSPACSRPRPPRAPTRRSMRASTRCAGIRGQIDCADALRALMAGSAIRASHLRRRRPRAGPLLPALPAAGDGRGARHAAPRGASVLGDEANGVSDNPLIFAEDGIALSGGNFHAEPVALAADMMALAICEIGSLAERRIAMLVDPGAVAAAGVPDAQAGSQLRAS